MTTPALPPRPLMASDATFKTDVAPVDAAAAASILASVLDIPIFTYSYQAAPGLSHIGPFAQSTATAQGWNTTFASRTPTNACLIDVGDMVGTTLACIQALAAGGGGGGSSVWEWAGSVLTPKTGGAPNGTLAFPRTTVVTGSGTRTTFAASNGAFRAGTVTGTQWDATGADSAALGLDNAAQGPRTSVLGGSGNAAAAGSADSAVVCGQSNTVGADGVSSTSSTDCAVLNGVNNTVAGGACSWVGGASSCSVVRGQMSAVCSGQGSAVSDSSYTAVVSGSDHSAALSSYCCLAGGQGHSVFRSTHCVVAGGYSHGLTGSSYGVVGGGYGHGLTDTEYCAVLSGVSNTISGAPGQMSVIAGGIGNTMASTSWSVVCAGSGNGMGQVTGCFIGAGQGVSVTGSTGAAVAGGTSNALDGSDYAFIGAGNGNSVSASPSSAVGCGSANRVAGSSGSFVLCGSENTVSDACTASGVITGTGNGVASSDTAVVLGAARTQVTSCANVAVLAAEACVMSGSDHCTLLSGTGVTVESCSHAIAAGDEVGVGGSNHAVALGATKTALRDAPNALVGPVENCTLDNATGCCALVGGDVGMSQSTYCAVVCASGVSVLTGTHCAVLCGSKHSVQDADSCSILSGTGNAVFGTSNAACGAEHTVRAGYAFVAGQGHAVGEEPTKCTHAVVSGLSNTLSGSTVHLVHGESNALGFGDHSVFLGSNAGLARVAARNVLVAGGAFSDSGEPAAPGGQPVDLDGTLYNAAYLGFGATPQSRVLPNCFTAIFNGENKDKHAFELWTTDGGASGGAGLYVEAGGADWVAASSRDAKEDVVPVDEAAVAASARRVPLVTFRYRGGPDGARRSFGSIAQDWAAAFHGLLPGPDDPEAAGGIGVMSVAFVALAAARDAQRRIDALEEELRALRG